jgi:hypothetical protein
MEKWRDRKLIFLGRLAHKAGDRPVANLEHGAQGFLGCVGRYSREPHPPDLLLLGIHIGARLIGELARFFDPIARIRRRRTVVRTGTGGGRMQNCHGVAPLIQTNQDCPDGRPSAASSDEVPQARMIVLPEPTFSGSRRAHMTFVRSFPHAEGA